MGVAEKRWSGGSRSRNGAGSGGYRIRLEHRVAFSPAPLRSHALAISHDNYWNFCLIAVCTIVNIANWSEKGEKIRNIFKSTKMSAVIK